MTLKIVPLELKELNALVAAMHRHHKPVVGHRFSIGLECDGKLIGGYDDLVAFYQSGKTL